MKALFDKVSQKVKEQSTNVWVEKKNRKTWHFKKDLISNKKVEQTLRFTSEMFLLKNDDGSSMEL